MGEEPTLMLRARAGDLSALERVLQQHGPALFRLGRSVLGCTEDAQDALQEVVVRLLERPGLLDPRRPPGPYLWRAMVNECFSRLRRRRLDVAVAAHLGPGAQWHEPCPGPAVVDEVRRAIAQLPARQSVAITLVGLEGLDLCSAAQAMGCSVGALKSHLHRAREKLKAHLGDHLP